jgi:hypothetical protein
MVRRSARLPLKFASTSEYLLPFQVHRLDHLLWVLITSNRNMFYACVQFHTTTLKTKAG